MTRLIDHTRAPEDPAASVPAAAVPAASSPAASVPAASVPAAPPPPATLPPPPAVRPGSVPLLDPAMRYLARPPAPGTRPPAAPPRTAAARAAAPAAPRRGGTSSAAHVRRRVETALRLVLEVLDRRRRPQHLAPFADAVVVDAAARLARTGPPGHALGAAALRRIHITAAGTDAAEVCATYERGRRTLAIAGRFEARGGTWVCTALHLA